MLMLAVVVLVMVLMMLVPAVGVVVMVVASTIIISTIARPTPMPTNPNHEAGVHIITIARPRLMPTQSQPPSWRPLSSLVVMCDCSMMRITSEDVVC